MSVVVTGRRALRGVTMAGLGLLAFEVRYVWRYWRGLA